MAQRPDSGSDRCCPGACPLQIGGGAGEGGQLLWPCPVAILGTLLATTFSRVAFKGNQASESWDRRMTRLVLPGLNRTGACPQASPSAGSFPSSGTASELPWANCTRPLPALFLSRPAGFFYFVSVNCKWGVEPRTQSREGERKVSAIWILDLAEIFFFFLCFSGEILPILYSFCLPSAPKEVQVLPS